MLFFEKLTADLLVLNKIFRRILLTVCFLLFCKSIVLYAQSMDADSRKKIAAKYTSNTKNTTPNFYIVTYDERTNTDFPAFTITRTISPGIAIIKKENLTAFNAKVKGLQTISPANDNWKMSASLELHVGNLQQRKNINKLYTISADNISDVLSSLIQKKIVFELISVFKETNSAVIRCNASVFFSSIIPNPHILFADVYIKPSTDLMVSGYYRHINKINEADNYFPGANGKGITIGIKERMMDETDIDLQKRILPSVLAAPQKEFHANVVATLAGGAGNSFYTGKGLASHCKFFPSTFNNLFPDSTLLLLQNNVTVQNHAYGTVVQQFYGAEAVSYDMQTHQNKSLMHVFSSGNKGLDSAGTGIYANVSGFANLTGNFKMAKNVITVAAVDTGLNIAPFSSAGPLYDGRLAPQIAALGPNGTSEAAAIVSGAAAVLQQIYKDSTSQSAAPASLIKAILFVTADDIGNKGIDYKTGFGLLNIYTAINCLINKNYDGNVLAQGSVWSKSVSIPVTAANLKVNLVWTDTAAQVNTNKALVNDLDLELVEMNSGMIYKPWGLSQFPNKDSLSKLPIRKRDSLNTAEQVSIDFPAGGIYQIRVTGKQVQTANMQAFHVAWSWDTLQALRFTNPIRSSDIDRKGNDNLSIKWSVAVVDTNAVGNLSISFDDGNDWEAIGTDVKIFRQSFNWQIPEISSVAQLRMETGFGSYYSERFVIAPLTKLKVDYRCTDSLRLSWQKHFSASSYQLYALGDSSFLKPVLVVSDTSIVLKKNLFSQNVYAVAPILASGVPASRSVAIDVRNQGVECFYKTLIAETRGDSIELNLELSFMSGITSLEFEKVTASGNKISTISKIIPATGLYSHMAYDNAPTGGMNYYRVAITFNGSTVFTYIVPVLHNGQKNLLLYPNPVTRGQNLNFRIKESFGNATMQLTDVAARTVVNIEVPLAGGLKTTSLRPGIYFITVRNNKGNIATEKIIIQ